MSELPRFAAFISYASADAPFAQRLHGALERYRIPKALGKFVLTDRRKSNRIYPVFRDREELSAGNLGERIEASLRDSGALIVVCSPHAAASPWVQKEIEYFASLGRRDRIFAIIHDKAPLADGAGADATPLCFPAAFRGDAIADASALEPLAADARKGKDGFRNAWLKLVAGLADATPGQLIDRDRQRRRAQMLQAAAVWTLVVIGVAATWINRPILEPLAISYTRYRPYVESNASLLVAAPGTTFQDCRNGSSDCPVMVVIPEGRFLMGSAADDPGTEYDERPLHEVAVQRFAAAQFEVTFADWIACLGAGGCGGYVPDRAGWDSNRRPVINVTWSDARAYAAWLTEMTGVEYRLLSEAEWEYAARAVTARNGFRAHFSWGNAPAVCDVNATNGAVFYDCEARRTWEVGSFHPNAFGLYDMHGNVWEWVQDCYADNGYGAAASPVARSDTGCVYRVDRGGSWNGSTHYLRSANRNWNDPVHRDDNLGFRVARSFGPADLEPPESRGSPGPHG